jgi:hypothetical protein
MAARLNRLEKFGPWAINARRPGICGARRLAARAPIRALYVMVPHRMGIWQLDPDERTEAAFHHSGMGAIASRDSQSNRAASQKGPQAIENGRPSPLGVEARSHSPMLGSGCAATPTFRSLAEYPKR